MKKGLVLSVLTAGGILSSLASGANAASLIPCATDRLSVSYCDRIDFRETQWRSILSLPQYDPSSFRGAPLRKITMSVTSQTQGQYVLTAVGSELGYGDPNDRVGALLRIDGPLGSVTLRPNPITNVGTGLLNVGDSLFVPLNGADTKASQVANSFFSTFTGSGVVNFSVLASVFLDVTLTGTSFVTFGTTVQADLDAKITYQYAEVPDRGFGLMSVAFCGLAGLALKRIGNNG